MLKQGLAVLAVFALGTGLGYWLVPTKVVTKTQIVTKVVERKVVNKDVHTKITKTIDDKGRPVIVIERIDTSKVDDNKNTDSKENTTKIVEKDKLDWIVTVGALYNPTEFKPYYFLGVDKRLFGELYIGAFGVTDGKLGLGISYRF